MFTTLDPLWVLIALAIFTIGIIRRIRLWMMGQKDEQLEGVGQRLKDFIVYAIGHRRILRELYPGLMHLFIFCACAIPLLVILAVQIKFSIPQLPGNLFSLFLDAVGSLGLLGIVLAAYRRYIQKPDRLSDTRAEDAIALIWVFAIIFLGFCIEGLRLSITGESGVWAPVGYLFAACFSFAEPGTQVSIHKLLWRIHLFLVIGLVACTPYTKFLHIITSAINIFLRKYGPPGVLRQITDFETAETFGVSRLEEFTRQQLFHLDACTRCGRCQDNCPAHLTEKPLSPKKLYQDLRTHMEERGAQAAANGAAVEKALIGDVIEHDTIWSCTMCLNCHFQCPVFITSVDKTIEMRRNLVLVESNFPVEVQAVFKNMENNSNPWGIGRHMRGDWAKELGVKTMAEAGSADVLLYAGCAGAFDDRYKKVATAMVKILQAAGVDFAILGNEEGCCGDSARRIGNEYLYDSLAQYNLGIFQQYGVKKILTICPHCYNALKNEYPQYGAEFKVLHHTELLLDLVKTGKISLNGSSGSMSVCYHDSCFLGRYNDIYDQPRKLLTSISGISLVEMDRTLDRSFCCGAGGGRMWMEEHLGTRINEARTEQAIAKKPDAIATACPYCLTMFEDGLKSKNVFESIKALDIAEYIYNAMQK
jgi:Fe-S oxidoreductase/nitrate reductase gamma subunit